MFIFSSSKDETHRKRRPWACKSKISIKNKLCAQFKIYPLSILLNLILGLNILIYFYPHHIDALVKADLIPQNNQVEFELSKLNNSKLFIKTNSSLPVLGIENFENLNDLKILNKKPADSQEKHKYVWITAYSSSFDETDDTPYITAYGTPTRDGIVATNLLPFKTKIKIPEIFGDKIFTVEDRMHERKTNFVDIWMSSKEQALKFGIHYSKILILEEGNDFAQK